MPAHYTFVFAVNDEEAFKAEWHRLHAMFGRLDGKPYGITAISHAHEMQRVSQIEDAVTRYDDDHGDGNILAAEVASIVNCVDPVAWTPEEVENA